MSETKINEIEINGTKYVRADSVATPVPSGSRCVMVLDRGWIFAGDVSEANGRISLARAVQVRSWSGLGFEGMLAAPKSDKVVLRKMPTLVDFPRDAELFRCPVADDWGL